MTPRSLLVLTVLIGLALLGPVSAQMPNPGISFPTGNGSGGGGGGGGTPSGSVGDLQTNAGGGNFGHLTPGTGMATALAQAANSANGILLANGSPTISGNWIWNGNITLGTGILLSPAGGIEIQGTGSGVTQLQSSLTSTTSSTMIFPPESSDTLVDLTGIQTLSNKTFVAPTLGAAIGTSLALGGATLGSNALAVTGHLLFEGVASTGATGTGNLVFGTSPTFVSPTIGAAIATTVNKWTFTAPATGATLTAGADAVTYTGPAASKTLMASDFSNATIVQNAPADGGSHSYTILSSDLTKQVLLVSTFTAAAVPQATGSFAAPADFTLCVAGAVTVTSTTSTINGIAGATGIKMQANQCAEFTASSGNWGASLTLPQAATQTGTLVFQDNGWTATPTLGASGTAGTLGFGNATSGVVTLGTVAGALGTVTASLPANAGTIAETNLKQSWTAAQRGTPVNIAISTATFTPNFDTGQNFEIDLTSACPCTLANPSTTLVAGQSGMFEIHQDGSGSRTIGTWGSAYLYVGGTSTITPSTAASAIDFLPYYVNNAATGIVLGTLLKAPVH